MSRALTLTAVFGLFVAGLGCHHVAGKCDCTFDPADFPLPTPNQPYPQVGSPIVGSAVTPLPAPAPVGSEKMPPAKELKNGR